MVDVAKNNDAGLVLSGNKRLAKIDSGRIAILESGFT